VTSESSDAELLERWRAGDDRAGNQLVRRHFDPLYRFFRSRLDDGIADLVQQTFLGCVESRDRIPTEDFRLYLYGIARKKLLMHLRSRRRRGRVIDDHAPGEDGDAGTISRVIGHREEQRLLFRALRRLSVDLQLGLVLAYWEGLSVADIGTILHIPAGTVKSRLFRARELLKEHIAQLAPSLHTASVTVNDLDRWARELRDVISVES
jgi:RNA polymerase sigma-70 factor (ECF subfamily)